ncbi:MAG: NAD(P)-dependent oxidoreductase [Planctomycetota bacterium]|nr:NAD(P)-dependent oxidoreductase [Planctomycetota bacterium]
MADRLNVLLTGAAGRVGQMLLPSFKERYALRAFDRVPVPGDPAALRGDLEDAEGLRQAMAGVDVLVHLAADPNPFAKFREELVGPNIVGLYNAFQAAVEAKVRRVVYASSVQTVMARPFETDSVDVNDPPRPHTLYGATKHFGEVLGRWFHDHHPLEFVALRLGGTCKAKPEGFAWKSEAPWNWLSDRDAVQLFTKAIETPGVGFLVAFGRSKTVREYMSLRTAREVLGYEPQDDVRAHLPPRE